MRQLRVRSLEQVALALIPAVCETQHALEKLTCPVDYLVLLRVRQFAPPIWKRPASRVAQERVPRRRLIHKLNM
jgi:hypothetical protein